MSKLPWPPAGALPEPDLVAVHGATLLWRIYDAGGPHATTWDGFRRFGPVATARFDPHPPPAGHHHDRGVLYVGLAVDVCVAEVFQATRLVDRRRRGPWVTGFSLRRPVTLLDLTGDWPTRAGASQAIATGPRDRARAWARRVHASFPAVEGLWYRSSMLGGGLVVCLWERAAGALPDAPAVHLPLAHPGLEVPLARVARRLGYRLR